MKQITLLLALLCSSLPRALAMTPPLKNFCQEVASSFKRYGWKDAELCETYNWNHVRNSVKGHALPWVAFGDESSKQKPNSVTMVFCAVHGDEITPVKFCFDIMKYLKTNYELLYSNRIIVVAPIANPDSFFIRNPTRFNSNGIDINRNFPTKNWHDLAHKQWGREKQDKRRFPGKNALSEPETIFQVNLIKRYSPDKIISVHSPLTMLDYDGPTMVKNEEQSPQKLLHQMSKMASNYRIKNFGIFPGSLGNWAGKERNIPTYTLELPTSNPKKTDEYWDLFREALHQAFLKDLSMANK